MASDPGSVKSLRRFYKNRLVVPDSGEMLAELTGSSDRAVVITLGAFLDSILEYVLASKMRPQATEDEFEEAFASNGPLGSFSSKIKVAYLFQLIDEPLKNQLETIREMRNACAHAKRPISFANPELANVGKRILHPHGSFRRQGETPADIRSAFTAECMFLHGVLLWGRDKAVEETRAAYSAAEREPPF